MVSGVAVVANAFGTTEGAVDLLTAAWFSSSIGPRCDHGALLMRCELQGCTGLSCAHCRPVLQRAFRLSKVDDDRTGSHLRVGPTAVREDFLARDGAARVAGEEKNDLGDLRGLNEIGN